MILSDYFYAASLEKKQYKIRENCFCPARSLEVFGVWLDYIRKFWPDEHIVFFDNCSEIPFEQAIGDIPYEVIPQNSYSYDKNVKIHIKRFDTQYWYFHAVQRQRVEALKFAYFNNEDYLWIDTDCLINTNLRPLYTGYDVFAPLILHDQMTIDAHCLFLSNKRLHEWDKYYKLPEFLDEIMLAPDENQSIRHMTLFEGGMYKLFCYGSINSSQNINESHAASWQSLIKFLDLNSLDTDNYRKLKYLMNNLDFEKLKADGADIDKTSFDRLTIEK